jgi:hypothetical protein
MPSLAKPGSACATHVQQHIFRKFNVQNGVELANLMKN